MYKLIKNYFSHKDERGEVRGLINFDKWQEVNYITSVQNSIRGNHYHKSTKEVIVVLDGEIDVQLKNNQRTETLTLHKNDIILIEPYTYHTFTCVKESSWINLLTEKMDKDNPDIYN